MPKSKSAHVADLDTPTEQPEKHQRVKDQEYKLMLADSLVNFAAGLGVSGEDKRVASSFTQRNVRLERDELEALYKEDWIAGKIIDIIAEDMTREWRTFSDKQLSTDQITELETFEKKLKVKKKFNLAKRWARLYGGSVIVLHVDDGNDPEEELNLDSVKELIDLIVFDRHQISPVAINITDPFSPNFRLPEMYGVWGTNHKIHHSRIVRFDGVPLPHNLLVKNNYWGDSVLQRLYDSLINVNLALDSSANMLFESNVDVVKVPNLQALLSDDIATEQLMKRFTTAKHLKSNLRMTLLDQQEDLDKNTITYSGIDVIIEKFFKVLNGASDIPTTRLFGTSPGGLNTTGEGDLTNYYDNVRSRQETEFRDEIAYVDMLMGLTLGIDPDKIDFDFDSLWQLSDLDQSTIKVNNATADAVYDELGVVDKAQIAKDAQAKRTYSTITDADIERLQKEAEQERQLKAKQHENMVKAAEVGELAMEGAEADDIEEEEGGITSTRGTVKSPVQQKNAEKAQIKRKVGKPSRAPRPERGNPKA